MPSTPPCGRCPASKSRSRALMAAPSPSGAALTCAGPALTRPAPPGSAGGASAAPAAGSGGAGPPWSPAGSKVGPGRAGSCPLLGETPPGQGGCSFIRGGCRPDQEPGVGWGGGGGGCHVPLAPAPPGGCRGKGTAEHGWCLAPWDRKSFLMV